MKTLFSRRDDHFFAEVITNNAFARLSALWKAIMTTGSYSAEQVDAADKAPRDARHEQLAGVYSDLSPNGDYDGRSRWTWSAVSSRNTTTRDTERTRSRRPRAEAATCLITALATR